MRARVSPVALTLAAALTATGPSGLDLRTNLSRALVPLEEIRPGGPLPDASRRSTAHSSYAPPAPGSKRAEPVLALEINGDPLAYPLQILVWQEIVNDTVRALPVTATFCPLCNSGIVFDRRLDWTTTSARRAVSTRATS